ncbi:hypothetical protein HJFPF1_02735 [Paramyrothecium foliicola]|nr:hypothetical protein HJFPF1_02735 [Paramyrothecium foliicola]
MARQRRSARLASAAKNKPTPELSSVVEYEELPRGTKASPAVIPSSPAPAPSTPASSAIKPPYDEMHPSKAHNTTGPPSSALRLGFTDIQPDEKQGSHGKGRADATPSRTNRMPSSAFTFRASPLSSGHELSSDAQRLMSELRDQAAKIKADLVAQREAAGDSMDPNERKIIKPKGKAGRFSAAHIAEFKKMDSIEGHASAWRAQEGRFTPIKSALKRSPSKADLDVTPTPVKSALKRSPSKPAMDTTPTPARTGFKRSPSKADLDATPSSRLKPGLKRKSSAANLDSRQEVTASAAKSAIPLTPSKMVTFSRDGQQSGVKRFKKRLEDDSSTARPISRDGSNIPQPTAGSGGLNRSDSALARLTSPTKASLAHIGSHRKPTISLVASPLPKPDFGGLGQSATTQSATSPSRVTDLKRRIISPGRFQKVKSILRGQKPDATAIPQPVSQVSQTPGPRGSDKTLPPLPLTTPRRRLVKHVSFTPETNKATTAAAAAQNSPSPQKYAISKFKFKHSTDDSQYPTVDSVLAQSSSEDVVYPDLSSFHRRTLGGDKDAETSAAPGTFTFRSDHTIQFGATSPTGFGASPGQSSIRHVPKAMAPTAQMPGSFPDPSAKRSLSDKENNPPSSGLLLGVPHGMSNKKRHRASSDEEDAEREASERAAAKKRKNENVPDGQVLLKTRPLGTTPMSSAKRAPFTRGPSQTPSRTPSRTPARTLLRTPSQPPASATPTKKRGMLSMSRLNMLSRPKNRA